MSTKIITNYVFDPENKQIRITEPGFDIVNLVSIYNVNFGKFIYNVEEDGRANYEAITGNLITLNQDLTGMADTDTLVVKLHTDYIAKNMSNKIRESFEKYEPNTGGRWAEEKQVGDIIDTDGNTAAASYLVVSKDPLSVGVSKVETVAEFNMPIEAAFAIHTSQRTLGQEFALELESSEEPLPTPLDLQIASISQAASVLTVNTVQPHGLRIGVRMGIRDCVDSRMNYPAVVVATTPSETQFTVTAGPMGNLPSLTVGPFTSGFVFFRSALGYAQNGASMILENNSVTNASFYVRSESGDVLPSGAIAGNHGLTIATTAPVQAVNAANAYAFQPTSEYRLTQFADGLQWSDSPIDSIAAATSRIKRTQVVPDIDARYKFRIRATNNPSLSRPVAQIISAVKSASTTAIITTNVPHGLTTADQAVVYGIRDQAATAFPNLLVATPIASIVSPTVFTIVIGTSGTVTSYGGYVARVNGGNLMSALGGIAQVVQSVSRTGNVLTVNGNVAWTNLQIGDYSNLVGVRNAVDGATLEIDGAYRVANIVTTVLTLEPINNTVSPTGNNIVLTNCGGAVIKRTDLRISFIRIFDFERQRVEMLARPTNDMSAAAPVSVQNVPNIGSISTLPILPAGTNLIGDMGVQYRANATGAASRTHLVSAATTNATIVRNAAARLLGWQITNTNAATRYVKLHNIATAPTAGTGVVQTIAVPPNQTINFSMEGGIAFTTGIGLTTTTGATDADAVAVGANDLVIDLFWA
jgi:hypothetical protein